MKEQPVIVRKYGNRRLYDTSSSRYINLDDIAAMIRNGTNVKVVDAVTQEDLTHVTLTQIIVEHAKEKPTSFPLELLRELIVVSDHVGREFITWYLRSGFDAYQKVQKALQTGVATSKATTASPLDLLKKFIPGSLQTEPNDELSELRARVAELETKVRKPRKARRAKSKAKASGA